MKIFASDMGRIENLVRRMLPSLHFVEARLSCHKAGQLIELWLTLLSSTAPLLSPQENPHNIRSTRDQLAQRNEATRDSAQRVLLDAFRPSG
jgi:hypothetical protein